jgi:hypothetical protein
LEGKRLPADREPSAKPEDTLTAISTQLAELSERLVGGPRPDDPQAAARYDRSLYWLISHLSEGVHLLNNFMQVLIGRVEAVGKDLNRNEGTNRAILQATDDLRVISQSLVKTAKNIEKEVGAVVPDTPLLMRRLWYVPTDAVEIGLILFLLVDSASFLIGSGALVNSPLFHQLRGINESPRTWGVMFTVLLIGYVLAFFSRRRQYRRIAAFACFVFLGGVGTLTMAAPGGVPLGPLHHLLAAAGAAWVLSRGPSNAI